METKFNFNSQVCTSKIQSERLLSLGLKKETADMFYDYHKDRIGYKYYLIPKPATLGDKRSIPAWSLHRLIEMMPYSVEVNNKTWTLQVSKGYARYGMVGTEKAYVGFIQRPNTYDAIIDCIEWLIKEGEFEKEYLV